MNIIGIKEMREMRVIVSAGRSQTRRLLVSSKKGIAERFGDVFCKGCGMEGV